MNDIQKVEPVSAPVVQADASSVLALITRAAADASMDVDKLERLMAMHERLSARQAEQAYAAAFAVMQAELPVIGERGAIKNRDEKVQSKYALWEDVNDAIKPVISRHGFSLSFRTDTAGGKVTVTAVLRHSGGHSDTTTMELMADTSGSKNAVQSLGSSVSYGKRYTAFALLNITSRGEDDDGKAGGAKGCISDEQASELRDALDAAGGNVATFCRAFGVERFGDLPVKRFDEAKQRIAAYAAKQRATQETR